MSAQLALFVTDPVPPEIAELVKAGALFVVNHSGGKDSQAMLLYVRRLVPDEQIVIVHADLPEVDWPGIEEHIRTNSLGLPLHVCRAQKTFFDMVERRGLFFDHETINHGASEFVRDGVTTNSIESVFAVLKRGLIGVYHHASPKHLHRYVDEFAFRLNEGKVERHTLDRLASFVRGVAGKRLTYKALIA